MMIIRIFLVACLVAVFIQEAYSAPRPQLTRQLSFNTSSVAPPNLVQAQLLQLDKDVFCVVNLEVSAFRLTTFTANWTKSESLVYPLPNTSPEFLAFSGPNQTVIFGSFISYFDHLAGTVLRDWFFKVDTHGQVLYNITLLIFDSLHKSGCRINEDLFAFSGIDLLAGGPHALFIMDNSLSLVHNITFQDGKFINVGCDDTHVFLTVHFPTGLTSVVKYLSTNFTTPIAMYNTTRFPVNDSSALSVVGDSLILSIAQGGVMRVLQLTTSTLSFVAYNEFTDTSGTYNTLRYPSYTSEGYFLFPSKLQTTGSWIEYPMDFSDGQIQPKTINTLWTLSKPKLAEVNNARFFNDMYGNGYIAVLTDIDQTKNFTWNNLMFFGDVCGDGIVTGTIEQCDGGEFCTIKCQCQSGYKPMAPLSNDCVLDTSFTNCSSCLNDTSHCDVSRGACVSYRVAPILQCVENRAFGTRRAYFSYRSNHTASIAPGTSSNVLSPHGTPIGEFEYGRTLYYPFSAFYVDYPAGTTTVEWFVDGFSVTFDVSNSSLTCLSTLSLLIEAITPSYSELIQFANKLSTTLARAMKIETNFVMITTPQNNATQTTMFFRADISDDTINSIAATDAIRTLFSNVSVVFVIIPQIVNIRIMAMPNEIGEGVIAADDALSPIAWSPGSIQVPPDASPDSLIPSNGQQPSSGVISDPNSPVNNNASGWSNDYIAAIILIPAAVGVAIFLAVYFSRKKKLRAQGKKSLINNSQFNTPLTELRADKSMNYTSVPDTPSTDIKTGKYGPIAAVDNKNISDRLRVPYADLKFKKEIGAGAYGKVFIGEWQRTKVALKINTSATGDDFAREARLMVELRPHPNVVQMLGVSSDGPYPVMILEFCDGGSLDDKLFNMSEVITPQQQLEIVLGIAKGLYHLHKNQIVHRDLAARNILLSRDEPKISDFGLSRQVGEEQKGTTKSNVGPIRWMAPESLKQMVYSAKSDVWTFGIVVYEIIARHEPHSEADQMAIGLEIRDHGATPTIPSECDPVLQEIMNQCWRMAPEERPTMEQICDILDRYMEEKR